METIEKKRNKKGLVSTSFIIIAALIIIIAANGIVWKNRLARSAEINTLINEINRVSHSTTGAPVPPANLQARLAETKLALATAQMAIPSEFNRNDVIDYIINLAKECRVEVLPILSQGWAAEKIGQPYPVLVLNGTITGSFTRATDFVSRLQHGKYPTLSVPEINISRQSLPDSTGAFSGDNTMVTVKLKIAIYARPSTTDKGTK